MKDTFYKRIAAHKPDLAMHLRQAGMRDTPVAFVKKTFMSSMYMSIALVMVILGFVAKGENKIIIIYVILIAPAIFFMLFLYFLKAPEVKMLKREREISREIVFAGRYLIIELKSGVGLYEAMNNVVKNFPVICLAFREIVIKIGFGTSVEDALNQVIEITPSDNFRKILWQILNSLKTGADISDSLSTVLEQIVREQVIAVNEYGKKLNPLAMFYMMIAVILPTIGIAMFIVLSTFISLSLELWMLLLIAGFLGFIQFMFVAMIKSQRPAVEL
jgi:flagellar protein FlaJ